MKVWATNTQISLSLSLSLSLFTHLNSEFSNFNIISTNFSPLIPFISSFNKTFLFIPNRAIFPPAQHLCNKTHTHTHTERTHVRGSSSSRIPKRTAFSSSSSSYSSSSSVLEQSSVLSWREYHCKFTFHTFCGCEKKKDNFVNFVMNRACRSSLGKKKKSCNGHTVSLRKRLFPSLFKTSFSPLLQIILFSTGEQLSKFTRRILCAKLHCQYEFEFIPFSSSLPNVCFQTIEISYSSLIHNNNRTRNTLP